VDGVERVELDEGALEVRVRPQRAGESFFVILPDGQIEVRGTTFDVTVEGGATARVSVREGVVELRLRDVGVTRIGAGETWAAAPRKTTPLRTVAGERAAALAGHPSIAAPPVASPASPSASVAPASVVAGPSAAGHSAADDAAAYAAATRLLREGRNDEAAAAFDAYVRAHPSASQAEDASFLEALALARGGRTDAAALAAEHHLASFPRSFHREDAVILIARAAAQRGECTKAQALLAPWASDRATAEDRALQRACVPR
jgi:TolA-binding protein